MKRIFLSVNKVRWCLFHVYITIFQVNIHERYKKEKCLNDTNVRESIKYIVIVVYFTWNEADDEGDRCDKSNKNVAQLWERRNS